MLLGTYTPKMDEKSRLYVPSDFRAQMQSGVVLARGQERCVFVFVKDEFEAIREKIKHLSTNSKQGRDYLRFFFSGANFQVPDKQGRITLPAGLREWAGIDKDVCFVGVGNRAEIWDLSAWNKYISGQEEAFANIEISGLF